MALSSVCRVSSLIEEILSRTGSNRTPIYHSERVYGDLTASILFITAGSLVTRSFGPTLAREPTHMSNALLPHLIYYDQYISLILPYFSLTFWKSKCIVPPATCLASHNRESVAKRGPLKCRRRYQLRNVWITYHPVKESNSTNTLLARIPWPSNADANPIMQSDFTWAQPFGEALRLPFPSPRSGQSWRGSTVLFQGGNRPTHIYGGGHSFGNVVGVGFVSRVGSPGISSASRSCKLQQPREQTANSSFPLFYRSWLGFGWWGYIWAGDCTCQ